ncbi:flagellar hook capping FlgD N-terminal domain-containing protein [Liquorilactobacillus sicerae]|uniref:flagellar hook capping FlgD N-terminal domain-containing protein n=1 Tax=Liquorilactobacillus sicerae TaxID=1416943 RepID=UPI0024813BC3|nr:flagellar hook capping FlgD N-terminal domain-containing protein [Liquorilactobacillus sicerae]
MNDTLTSAIASLSSSTIYNNTDSSDSNTTVSMDDFLKILSATMSNPSIDDSSSSSSSSGSDYMSELAQYESLNTLTEMNQTLTASVELQQQQEALGMLGKNVTLTDNGSTVSGTVDQVKFENGMGTIVVNGNEYELSSLSSVSENS